VQTELGFCVYDKQHSKGFSVAARQIQGASREHAGGGGEVNLRLVLLLQ
jgi:hypothetical protein